ncbi:hypothetical protein [Pseudomonas gessardii]|jgi:hypothetical protein|nr:hypothetical protein [Pseudomonas gessardii]SMG64323.1 hypothetical protein BMETH_232_1 [methanotrophic bacterial endosymbiont of Bathymodiolus sp.]
MAIANAGAIFQVANMKFLQPAPTLDYRKNLILHALLNIELLCELAQTVAPELSKAIKARIAERERLCEMVTSMASRDLKQQLVVPAFFVESVMDELDQYPFSYEEITAVLDSPLRDVLLLQS